MIILNSIVPTWIGGIQLSTVVLKSYLMSKGIGQPIIINRFITEDGVDRISKKNEYRDEFPIVCFSVHSWNIDIVLESCRRIKQNTDCYIIAGGPAVTFDTLGFFNRGEDIDLIIKGEGESIFFDVIQALEQETYDFKGIPDLVYRKNGKIMETPHDPKLLNLETHDYLILYKEFKDIRIIYYETSRGCVFKCKYCSWNTKGKRIIRNYPLEKVLNDIEHIFSLPKLEMFLLTDSNIVLNKKRGLAILSKINELNQKRRQDRLKPVKINMESNPESLGDEDLLFQIKRLNVEHYSFGLQSISKSVLQEADRRFDREKYIRGINQLKEKKGTPILIEIIFGLPCDSYARFRRTLEFVISDLNADLFVCYRFSLLPGSRFWETKEKYGIIHRPQQPYTIIRSDTFSESELNKVEAYTYYLQIIYRVFRSLKKTVDKNFSHNKLAVYDEIIDCFAEKYGDFLKPKLVYHDGFVKDLEKIRSAENTDVRRRMQSDARRIIKKIQSIKTKEKSL